MLSYYFTRKFSFLLCVATLFFTAEISSYALPQFSLLTGNKCVNCHVNNQGGGLRNELGWYSYNEVGLIKPKSIGLEKFYELLGVESNSVGEGFFTYGLDFRLQTVRGHAAERRRLIDTSGAPMIDPETGEQLDEITEVNRKIFPMQLSFYGALKPLDWLTFEGSYNAGPKVYPGQQSWTGSALIQPTFAWPQLRVGFFMPSIGMRYDDHTMLVRQIVSEDPPQPLIAPYFSEYGAEISYEASKFFSVSAGAFGSKSLSENMVGTESLIDSANSPTLIGRAVVWPRFFEHAVNTYAGASILANGDFTLTNFFAGVGLSDRISLLGEYSHSNKQFIRKTDNFSLELMYQIKPALLVYGRAERGSTTSFTKVSATDSTAAKEVEDIVSANQFVFGAQIFLLPYIELRPEYRIQATNKYDTGRFAAQLHVYY